MKRILIIFMALTSLLTLHSQTINYSNVKVKTKTEKTKRIYPYDQFVMLNYGMFSLKLNRSGGATIGNPGGNVLGVQYGQVHIGGWYVSADVSLSSLHFAHSYDADFSWNHDSWNYEPCVDVNGHEVIPHLEGGKTSVNRISFGGGGIVRMVIPLYFYLGAGYLYQNVTDKTEEFGWVEYSFARYSPHSSGYIECGLQGNIIGFTIRAGYRYNFCHNHELSVGLGWTFGRQNKKSNPKIEE